MTFTSAVLFMDVDPPGPTRAPLQLDNTDQKKKKLNKFWGKSNVAVVLFLVSLDFVFGQNKVL